MSAKYDEVMLMVCDAARFKMALNSHKGAIETLTARRAADLAIVEIEELMKAVDNDDHEAIVLEAADVTNFLVAVVYNAIDGYRRRK